MIRENTEELVRIKVGSMVMLSPGTYLADDTLHPSAGVVGKVIDMPNNGNVLVEIAMDSDRGSFIILPIRMWIELPQFYVEKYSLHHGHSAWRLNDRAIRHIEKTPSSWMITDNGRCAQ